MNSLPCPSGRHLDAHAVSQTSHLREDISALERRARERGLADFSDHELLGLFAARAGLAAADDLALSILHRFGSLAAAVGSPFADLALVAGAKLAADLKLLHQATVRMALAQVSARDVLTSQSAVATYLRILLAAHPREQFWVLFLDKRNQLILSEMIAEGTVDHAPVYPREIVRRALEVNASALVLAHNHPSGDPTPSRADIEMTSQVVAAAQALRIAVHDHIIVGYGQTQSLRTLGLM